MDFLFAYGTLREGFPMEEIKWKEKVQKIGTGRVRAVLYDLGDYPGAVPDQAEEVTGDVYRLEEPPTTLALLDAYEGPEYIREPVDVQLLTGEQVKAWIYWYGGPVEKKEKIGYTDYRMYLEHKKTAKQYGTL